MGSQIGTQGLRAHLLPDRGSRHCSVAHSEGLDDDGIYEKLLAGAWQASGFAMALLLAGLGSVDVMLLAVLPYALFRRCQQIRNTRRA